VLPATRLPGPEMLAELQLPKADAALLTEEQAEQGFGLVSETCCFSAKSLKSELSKLNDEYF